MATVLNLILSRMKRFGHIAAVGSISSMFPYASTLLTGADHIPQRTMTIHGPTYPTGLK